MMVVTCFSNCESVEMFLNEKSLGQKTLQQAPHIDYRWLIPYRPGVLKAVCKNDGKVVCTKTLGTAAKPEKIVLLPDRKTIAADSRDLCHVMVHITDRDGTIIPSADNLITFTIEGSGRLIGLDNGDTNSIESCKSDKRKAYEGKCLAIIQSTNTQADITLTAASPQLTPAKIIIKSKL
jgi:beta-galactosidase